LRGARFDRGHDPALEHPGPQPTPQQLQHPPIAHPPLDLSDQGIRIDFVKATSDIGVEHPLRLAPVDRRPDGLQRVVGRQPGPEPLDEVELTAECRADQVEGGLVVVAGHEAEGVAPPGRNALPH
jgi:hypothetical protein